MKCDRCNGKGYRELVVGPHVNELGAVCGGLAKYDCRKCGGSGKRAPTKRALDVCPRCKGKKIVLDGLVTGKCLQCNGTGKRQ